MRYACFIIVISILISNSVSSQQNWQPVKGKIMTEWASKVDPASPLSAYPRPQMVRNEWKTLNGLWEYAILPKDQQAIPATSQGSILVPFAVESALSGVGKTVGKASILWYKKSITLSAVKNKNTLLHFGAVDWETTVYVN